MFPIIPNQNQLHILVKLLLVEEVIVIVKILVLLRLKTILGEEFLAPSCSLVNKEGNSELVLCSCC